jgi:pyridoxamine 5'-phosphate oxidase
VSSNISEPFSLFTSWYLEASGHLLHKKNWFYCLGIHLIKIFSNAVSFITGNLEVREIFLPSAMCLSTVAASGEPNARMLIMKGMANQRFTFYTDYGSQKGLELAQNSRAHLTFHWRLPPRQIRISGTAQKMSRQESVAYWRTRPRESQLSASVSKQSQKISSLAELEKLPRELAEKYKGTQIPCPETWGGYYVIPHRFEFWEGKIGRLHSRRVFELVENEWQEHFLAP